MRPTIELKDARIKLRLSEEMREHIERESEKKGISMSEYIRELIRHDMSGGGI